MCTECVIKTSQRLWKISEAMVVDSKGTFGVLCTMWNSSEVNLEYTMKTQHWILTKFRSIRQNNFFYC